MKKKKWQKEIDSLPPGGIEVEVKHTRLGVKTGWYDTKAGIWWLGNSLNADKASVTEWRYKI
jgi:hypothetical protein